MLTLQIVTFDCRSYSWIFGLLEWFKKKTRRKGSWLYFADYKVVKEYVVYVIGSVRRACIELEMMVIGRRKG